MHSMSSNWTKREASMEFPYTKELGVTTLQTTATAFRRMTADLVETLKCLYFNAHRNNIKNSFIQISDFSCVISYAAEFFSVVE